jgi:hypothetical protein
MKKKSSYDCSNQAKNSTCLLASAAMVFSSLNGTPSFAQTNIDEKSAAIQYYFYNDWQEGNRERMQVDATVGRVVAPLDSTSSLQGSFVIDTMSGASPLFHDTLSGTEYAEGNTAVDAVTGASKGIIEDQRFAGNIAYTKQFEQFEIQAGAELSDEDDYLARGGSLLGTIWSEDKNRSVSFGLSSSVDKITSSVNNNLDEGRRTWSSFLGITQVIDPISIVQVTLQVGSTNGFLSDQYKLQDNRPRSRETLTILTKYNRYIDSLEGALHIDYRYFRDTWSILAHSTEVSLYKELTSELTIRPLFRYYSQSKSDFYNSLYPPFEEGFYSADQRMGGFGGISSGLKVSYMIASNFSLQFLYEFIHQNPRLKLGSKGSAGVPDLYAHFMGGGLQWRW